MDSSNKIAEFMLETQEEIVRELKKVKKNRVHSETTPSHTSAKDPSELKTRKKEKYSGRPKHIEEEDPMNENSRASSKARKSNENSASNIPAAELKNIKSQQAPIMSESQPQESLTQSEVKAAEEQETPVKRELPRPTLPKSKNPVNRRVPPPAVKKPTSVPVSSQPLKI